MTTPESKPEIDPAPIAADALRGRRQMLMVGLAFAAPLLIAMLLRGIGWQPVASRNHGDLVEPPFAIATIALQQNNAQPYVWKPLQARFHLLVRQSTACDAACVKFADLLHRVWVAQGRKADRLDLLWIGNPPPANVRFRHWIGLQAASELDQTLQQHGVADARVLLVDPNGFVMMRYDAGFDPSGLRKDIARLLK